MFGYGDNVESEGQRANEMFYKINPSRAQIGGGCGG